MAGKSRRLVTALVECRSDGGYQTWGIKWYDNRVYPFAEVMNHESRSWALGDDRECESWHVKMGGGTLREVCLRDGSWYVVHDPDHDREIEGWMA